jgi:hypothetical protein
MVLTWCMDMPQLPMSISQVSAMYRKNGKHLGVAFGDVREVLYPTVGLHSKNERSVY